MQFIRLFLLLPTLVLVSLLTACGSGSNASRGGSNTPTGPSDLVVLAADSGLSVTQVDSTTGAQLGILGNVNVAENVGSMVITAQKVVYVSEASIGQICAYSLNTSTGALTTLPGSPFITANGQGVQGLAIDPSGKFLYATEPNANQVAVFAIASTGALTEIAGSPFATGVLPVAAAVDPSGKYLYVANLNIFGGISGLAIDALGGLSPLPGSPFAVGGAGGRRLLFHPNGKILYASAAGGGLNQIFGDDLDTTTGDLLPVAGSPFGSCDLPFGLAFDPSAKFLYVACNSDSTFSAFTVDASTGDLAPIAGSPFPTASEPLVTAVNPSGNLLYVLGNGEIDIYTLDSSTGKPVPVPVPPLPGTAGTAFVVVAKQCASCLPSRLVWRT